jgi:hypothetical protein
MQLVIVIVLCVAAFFIAFLLLYTRRRQQRTVKPPIEKIPKKTVNEPCPWCGSKEYSSDDPPFECRECGTVHHRHCWQKYGGCAIWDCRLSPNQEAEEAVLK